MRLAIVTNSFPKISETFVFRKVLGLQRKGLDIVVHANNRQNDMPLLLNKGNLVEMIPSIKYNLLLSPTRSFIKLLYFIIRNPLEVSTLLRISFNMYGVNKLSIKTFLLSCPLWLGRYDLIHFEFSGLAISYKYALPILKQRSKLLMSCRGHAEQIKPLIDKERVSELQEISQIVDKIHCVSFEMLQTMMRYGVDRDKIFINYPSIDTFFFHRNNPYIPKEKGPYQLLSVGRLHWKKGLEYGVHSIRILLDWGYDVNYTIVGNGQEAEKLFFEIHSLNLHERVTIQTFIPPEEIKSLLEKTDIFLLPSLSEGISNVVLEAMAMEVPVVSTTAGGMNEVIDDGFDGYLVPPRAPRDMAKRVAEMLNEPSMRQNIGGMGRKKIESKFNIQNQIDRFIEEYESVKRLCQK